MFKSYVLIYDNLKDFRRVGFFMGFNSLNFKVMVLYFG